MKSISLLSFQSGQPGTDAFVRLTTMRTWPAGMTPVVNGAASATSKPRWAASSLTVSRTDPGAISGAIVDGDSVAVTKPQRLEPAVEPGPLGDGDIAIAVGRQIENIVSALDHGLMDRRDRSVVRSRGYTPSALRSRRQAPRSKAGRRIDLTLAGIDAMVIFNILPVRS